MDLQSRFPLMVSMVWVVLAVSAGCGGYAEKSQPTAGVSATQSGQETTGEGLPDRSTAKSSIEAAKVEAESHNDGVPSRGEGIGSKKAENEVWFESPLAIVGGGIELVADKESEADVAASNSLARVGMNEDRQKESKPSSLVGWEEIVSMEVLDGEVKTIRNRLSSALQSVGRYNASYADVRTMGTTLAAVAAIAAEHPAEVRWKKHALSIRDLGTKLEEESQATGAKAYESARRSLESLIELLDGNSSADTLETSRKLEFSECVDRGLLMKRIEQSFEWLKKEVDSEQALQSAVDQAAHESSLLAAMARVIAAPDYPSAEEPEYAEQAKSLGDWAARMSREARSGNYTEFSTARDAVQKKCNECHSEYRF